MYSLIITNSMESSQIQHSSLTELYLKKYKLVFRLVKQKYYTILYDMKSLIQTEDTYSGLIRNQNIIIYFYININIDGESITS